MSKTTNVDLWFKDDVAGEAQRSKSLLPKLTSPVTSWSIQARELKEQMLATGVSV